MLTESQISNITSQMRKGVLEYCIMLQLSKHRCYTSEIISAMAKANLVVVEGTLYTLLNRLRKEGKLDYQWEESPKGPPRKYYYLTDFGNEVIGYMQAAWNEIASAIDTISAETPWAPDDTRDGSDPSDFSHPSDNTNLSNNSNSSVSSNLSDFSNPL